MIIEDRWLRSVVNYQLIHPWPIFIFINPATRPFADATIFKWQRSILNNDDNSSIAFIVKNFININQFFFSKKIIKQIDFCLFFFTLSIAIGFLNKLTDISIVYFSINHIIYKDIYTNFLLLHPIPSYLVIIPLCSRGVLNQEFTTYI